MIEAARTAAPGDWLLGAGADWWDLTRFGPPGYDAYVRVAFDLRDVDEPRDTARETLAVLAGCTGTPEAAYAAVWEGWCMGRPMPAPVLAVPERTMLLYTGRVIELRDAPAIAWSYGTDGWPPHLAWPADRSWCFACDVDEDLELTVGCDRATAGALGRALPGYVREVEYGAWLPWGVDD